jgi:heme exporter protein CcmD
MTEFWDMGGYGTFIWPSYGISALVLLGLVMGGVWRMKRVQSALAEFEQESPQTTGPGV